MIKAVYHPPTPPSYTFGFHEFHFTESPFFKRMKGHGYCGSLSVVSIARRQAEGSLHWTKPVTVCGRMSPKGCAHLIKTITCDVFGPRGYLQAVRRWKKKFCFIFSFFFLICLYLFCSFSFIYFLKRLSSLPFLFAEMNSEQW